MRFERRCDAANLTRSHRLRDRAADDQPKKCCSRAGNSARDRFRCRLRNSEGCGVHIRHGQRTIFFTKNGELLHAERLAEDDMEALDLGPTAASGGGMSSGITSISGIDANLIVSGR